MEDGCVERLVLKLHEVSGVKFGEYTLKSGLLTPIYIDLRVLVSHPALMNQVSTCCAFLRVLLASHPGTIPARATNSFCL